MSNNDKGTSPNGEVPSDQVGLGLASTYNNYSAKNANRKPLSQTLSGIWNRQAIEDQLQTYLSLALIPIPLRKKCRS